MLHNSGPTAIVVLFILLLMSVLSWAIMISKWRAFQACGNQSRGFLRAFRKSGRLSEIAAIAEQFRPSPLVAVFTEIHDEYQRQSGGRGYATQPPRPWNARRKQLQRVTHADGTAHDLARDRRAGRPFCRVVRHGHGHHRCLSWPRHRRCGDAAGRGAGHQRSTHTTAAGLVVAVPAVMGYNQLTARLREFGARIDDFGRELLNAIENAALVVPPASLPPQPEEARRASLLGRTLTTRIPRWPSRCAAARKPHWQTSTSHPWSMWCSVLLLIFMVTAPVLQSGVEVAVPQTRTVNQLTEEHTVVTIDKDQNVFCRTSP